MNCLGLTAVASLAVAFLAGCPVYLGDQTYRVCDAPDAQGCFVCPARTYSGACTSWLCTIDTDCPRGYACDAAGRCVAATTVGAPSGVGRCLAPADCAPGSTCGADNFCHAGDCGGGIGCPSGFTCILSGGRTQCLSSLPSTADAGDASLGATDSGLLNVGDTSSNAPPLDATMRDAAE